jgi:hypothetical protein
MAIPANYNYAEAWEKKRTAQLNEVKDQLEELHARETGKRPGTDQEREQSGCPAILTRRALKDKKWQEEEEAERQKLANAKPPIILDTTSGYKLVLPSKDLPVTREQLAELGQHQDDKIAADSRLWGGETGRLASAEHCLMIRGKDKHVNPVHFNRVQREVDRTAGQRNIVLKARQVGITTYVAARFFLRTMLQPGTLSVQVAHDQQSAEEIFRIVHRFLENLPGEWRRSALKASRANVRQIIFPKLDSEYRVESAADRCAGRGLTIQNLHCSEVARWPHDVEETLAALRAAVPLDGEIFLESTPSGAGGTFYEEWQAAPETGYVRHFFPWWWESSYERQVEIVEFTEEELELKTKHGLNDAQIAFRREMRSQFRGRFLEEYAENPDTCFLTSGNCMFDCQTVDEALKKPQNIVDSKQNGKLLYFLQPQPGRDYIIGVDPSSGHPDGDPGCIQVIDAESGMQCAEWHDRFRPEEAAHNAVSLAKDYHMAQIAVERNGVGEAVITELRVHSDYPDVYCSHGAPGWVTTDMSKERALNTLRDLVDNQPGLFGSHRFLQECRTFVRDRKGKCGAAPGTHDDMVMAMAIAQAVRGEKRIRLPEWKKEAA